MAEKIATSAAEALTLSRSMEAHKQMSMIRGLLARYLKAR
jgi:hypothetical protein